MSTPTPPEHIWLQFYDEFDPDEEAGEVTWCVDQINDNDVEYFRADVLPRTPVSQQEAVV